MQELTTLSFTVTIALQIGICGLLIWRTLHKRFRWFFIYILYALVESVIRLAVSDNAQVYFRIYWSTEVGDVVLTILAMRESFQAILLPEVRRRWFRWVFWSGIVVALTYATWQAWALPPRQAHRLIAMILNLESGLDIIMSTFGLLYAAAIGLFGVLRHQRATAIILGFTANSSIAIFGWITRSAFGTRFRAFSEWIPALAYIVAEGIWARDLLRNEKVLPEPEQTFEEMNEVIGKYIVILHRYLGRER
jgi:hypothetical protein